MIDWDAEQSDKFIGTTAAILSAIAAGASAAGGITAAHMASSGATDAAKLQTDAAKYGADKQDAATQRAEAFQRQQAENAWQNSQQTQRANYEQSKARYGSIAGVASQYGLNLGGMPEYSPGVDPHYDTGAAPLPSSSTTPNAAGTIAGSAPQGQGNAAALKALIDGGMDPQAAVSTFNQRYGRSTGNQAVYYDPSQHGGKATIGLPDAYLSLEPTGWGITPRSGGTAKAGTIAGASPYMAPPAIGVPQVNTAIPTPYQPGTIGSYGRMR